MPTPSPTPFDPNNPDQQPDVNWQVPPPADVTQTTPATPVAGTSTPVPEGTYDTNPPPGKPTTFDQDAKERFRLINQQGNVDQATAAEQQRKEDEAGKIYAAHAADSQQRINDLDTMAKTNSALTAASNQQLMTTAQELYNKPADDPEHWWNSRSTGGKIAAITGLILGGVAQGGQFFGGNKQARNPALDQLDNIIKDDIDSQKGKDMDQFKAFADMQGIAVNAENYRHWEIMNKQKQYELSHNVFATQLQKAAAESGSRSAQINAQQFLVTHGTAMADEARNWGAHNDMLNSQAASLIEKRRLEAIKDQEAAATQYTSLTTGKDAISEEAAQRIVQASHPNLTFSYDSKVAYTAAALAAGGTINKATGKKYTVDEAKDFVAAHPTEFRLIKPNNTPNKTTGTIADTNATALKTYTDTVRDYNLAGTLLDTLSKNPEQFLSKEDEATLAKVPGLIPGGGSWGGLFGTSRVAAIKKAQEDLKDRKLEAGELLHTTVGDVEPKTTIIKPGDDKSAIPPVK